MMFLCDDKVNLCGQSGHNIQTCNSFYTNLPVYKFNDTVKGLVPRFCDVGAWGKGKLGV